MGRILVRGASYMLLAALATAMAASSLAATEASSPFGAAPLPEVSSAMALHAQEPIEPAVTAPPLLPRGPSIDEATVLLRPVPLPREPAAAIETVKVRIDLPEEILAPVAVSIVSEAPAVPVSVSGVPVPCAAPVASVDAWFSGTLGARPACSEPPPGSPRVVSPALVIVGGSGLVASLAALHAAAPASRLAPLAAAPLFSRITKEKTLSGKREELFELIRKDPGIHLSELAKRAECGWGTVLYHLGVLERSGYVTVVKERGFKRFFPTGEYNFPSLRTLYALKAGPARTIYEAIRGSPGINGVNLAGKVGVKPASLARPLAQLVALGIVCKVRSGREVRFYLRAEDAPDSETEFEVVGVARPVPA